MYELQKMQKRIIEKAIFYQEIHTLIFRLYICAMYLDETEIDRNIGVYSWQS